MKLLPFWRHRLRLTASMTSFMATSSSTVQADAVLKDDRTNTRQVLQVCPEKPTQTNSPFSTAKPLGVRSPGRPAQSEHPREGWRKQLGKAENVTASAHSFSAQPQARPGRWCDWKRAGVHKAAALSCDYNIKQQEAPSVWDAEEERAQFRFFSTLWGLAHSWWLLRKSSNTPLLCQHNMPRLPTSNRAQSKQHVLTKQNLLPRTDSILLLSYNTMKIWLIWTQDCKDIYSDLAIFLINGKQWQDKWKLTLTS